MFDTNLFERLEFTQSARRHRVGYARIRQVLTQPVFVERMERHTVPPVRWLFLGDDMTGRALEVIIVEEHDRLVVIHAMDLRDKFRAQYEEGKRS